MIISLIYHLDSNEISMQLEKLKNNNLKLNEILYIVNINKRTENFF